VWQRVAVFHVPNRWIKWSTFSWRRWIAKSQRCRCEAPGWPKIPCSSCFPPWRVATASNLGELWWWFGFASRIWNRDMRLRKECFFKLIYSGWPLSLEFWYVFAGYLGNFIKQWGWLKARHDRWQVLTDNLTHMLSLWSQNLTCTILIRIINYDWAFLGNRILFARNLPRRGKAQKTQKKSGCRKTCRQPPIEQRVAKLMVILSNWYVFLPNWYMFIISNT